MKRHITSFLFSLLTCALLAGTSWAQQTYAEMSRYGIYEAELVEVTYQKQDANEGNINTVEASLAQQTQDVPLVMGTTFGFEYGLHCPQGTVSVLYALRLPDGRQVTAPKNLHAGDNALTFTMSSKSGFEWVAGDYHLSIIYQDTELVGQTFNMYQP